MNTVLFQKHNRGVKIACMFALLFVGNTTVTRSVKAISHEALMVGCAATSLGSAVVSLLCQHKRAEQFFGDLSLISVYPTLMLCLAPVSCEVVCMSSQLLLLTSLLRVW